jgi:lysophospholipase L1-like esterase
MGLPAYNPKWVLNTKPPEFSDPNIKKLVCIGDSITHGMVSADYPALLRQKLTDHQPPFFIINAGNNSGFAHHVLNRIPEIVQLQPDYITILIGTNDTNNSFCTANWLRAIILDHLTFVPSLEKFQIDLTRILEILTSQTKAKIAIFSIPPICEDFSLPIENHVLKSVAIIKELADLFSIEYIPLHEQFIEKITDLRNQDGNHQLVQKVTYKHWQSAVLRSIIQRFLLKKSWKQISKRNGFYLHVDPLHLNDESAEIIVNLIKKHLEL